jgi:hypothetical protein
LIGALPAVIAYTRTAGEPGKSPARELKTPVDSEQRGVLFHRSGEQR